jgi:hypothetical protein
MFTFDATLPTYRDWVRLLTQDQDVTTCILQDETINTLVTTLGYGPAIAQICDMLLVIYATQPDYIRERYGVEVRFDSRIAVLQELAQKARAGLLPDPFAGVQSPRGAAIQQTVVQTTDPARPLPTYTPPGLLGGFRTE